MTSAHEHVNLPQHDAGVRLIIAYKTVKAVAQVLAGVVLGVFLLRGNTAGLERWAHLLTQNVTNAAAFELARLILKLVTPHVLRIATVALLFDATLSGVEAYALHRRYWWSPWMIVLTTSALLPFEVIHFLHQPRVGRAILVLVNLGVVAYLVFRALKDVREQRALETTRAPR